MAVDPAAFVKWCYQQVLFSQPPWQSYRLFSSAADPCLLLTVLATAPSQSSRDSYSFSLPLFLFAILLHSFFNYMQPATTKASTDGVWSWVLMGAWESTPPPPFFKFKATLMCTQSHSIVTAHCRPCESWHLQHMFFWIRRLKFVQFTNFTLKHCKYLLTYSTLQKEKPN